MATYHAPKCDFCGDFCGPNRVGIYQNADAEACVGDENPLVIVYR